MTFFAERAGFEPAISFRPIHTFQACSFNHSDTSPIICSFNLPIAIGTDTSPIICSFNLPIVYRDGHLSNNLLLQPPDSYRDGHLDFSILILLYRNKIQRRKNLISISWRTKVEKYSNLSYRKFSCYTLL